MERKEYDLNWGGEIYQFFSTFRDQDNKRYKIFRKGSFLGLRKSELMFPEEGLVVKGDLYALKATCGCGLE